MKSFEPRTSRVQQKSFGLILCVCFSQMVALTVLAQQSTPSGFEERRLALVEKHDANGDGRLDANEREAMRQARQAESQGRGQRSRRQPDPHPKELLAKYDKDKSGWIDGDEWDVAGPTESGIIKKRFDANGNDKLEKEERDALLGAIKSGEIKGLYAGIAHHWLIRLAERKGRSRNSGQRNELLDFDKDGDGLASREELAAIRAARAKKQ